MISLNIHLKNDQNEKQLLIHWLIIFIKVKIELLFYIFFKLVSFILPINVLLLHMVIIIIIIPLSFFPLKWICSCKKNLIPSLFKWQMLNSFHDKVIICIKTFNLNTRRIRICFSFFENIKYLYFITLIIYLIIWCINLELIDLAAKRV